MVIIALYAYAEYAAGVSTVILSILIIRSIYFDARATCRLCVYHIDRIAFGDAVETACLHLARYIIATCGYDPCAELALP